ncbi:MAG: hypothetical protein ACYSUC_02530 [Planctomycetota bacterium]|jgi:hypothetical protein
MKITKKQLRRLIKEEIEGQTLMRYWKGLEDQLNRDFVGKKVRFSDLEASFLDDPTDAVGVVTRVEIGSFGYEGEGDALFFLDSDTIEVFERHGKPIATPDPEESVMVSAEFTKISVM